MTWSRESPSTPPFRSYFPYPDSMLPPRAEIRVMLERSNEDHSWFGEVEVSQKRAEGSRRALTREKNRILLSSSHRVSDDVSGFVSATFDRFPVRTHRSDLPCPLTIVKSPTRFSTTFTDLSVSFVDPLWARSRKWGRVYGPPRVDLSF